MAEKKKELKKIKSGFLQRGVSLAKLTLGTSGRVLQHGVANLMSSKDEKIKNWSELLRVEAGKLSIELGELKGSMMKAGQMLSMYGEYFLPAEANEMLKSLYSDSPPLQYAEIEKILQQELGAELLDQLEIDPVSIGSASLGQVHRAKIKARGEWIALKVQYPGVEKAIDSDLKAIRTILTMMKLVPREMPIEPIFAEIRGMLAQEVDYRNEAEETEKYYQRLVGDNRFVVPRVYRQFSSAKILATSLESGLSPDHVSVKSLSQDRRNQLGKNFLELYMKEFFEWGVVQTDPHLGNYRVRLKPDGQDQLILLDFGAVRTYAQDFLNAYKKMIKYSLENNLAELSAATQELRFLKGDEDQKIKADFMRFCQMTVEPFRGGIYDYKNSDLPQRLTKMAFQMIRSFKIGPPPREVVFLDRKTGGVFIFLVVMEAKFDPRPILDQFIAIEAK